ncbi:MAG TPA: ADP-ribosylglycohydrolase family protein [Clostridia bacterium]|nr:ADP-ribosylglycohydrolase family protein [Clostridia bacterium]
MTIKKDAFLGAFIGDALALGPHWIYDTDKIKQSFGEIKGIVGPLEDTFHKTKEKGEFTHYGDQMLMLAEYIIDTKKDFNQEDFLNFYSDWMEEYDGYLDHATKETLNNIKNNSYKGSDSEELAGIISVPVMYFLSNNYKSDAVKRTSATHDSSIVIKITEFILDLLELIEKGKKINESVDVLKEKYSSILGQLIDQAKENIDNEPIKAIKAFGQMCNGENAFLSSMYLILKYQDDFEKALLTNVQAGGDSAARGIMIGTILGAYHGIDVLPDEWKEDMQYFKKISSIKKTG